ncbi:hypothetical protein ACTFIU_008717 [Dictyostelium citrinum]
MIENTDINHFHNNNIYSSVNDNDNEVAIVGIGFRIPSGTDESINSPNELWNNLVKGFDGIVKTTERWNDNFNNLGEICNGYAGLLPINEWKSFDPLFFGINPSEVQTIDPQQRLLLKCTWEALEDASIDPLQLRGSNTSVYIGCSTIDYQNLNRDKNSILLNVFGSSAHSIPNRISYCFDFRGPSLTIDTACSSSLNAVNLGYKSIKDGTSNLSIVGGVNLIFDPMTSKAFTYLDMLSKSSGRCMSFDERADGFVRSETAGIVVLKSLKQAKIDGNKIYCVIKGSSSNVDGSSRVNDKSNFYSPSSSTQSDNIKLAIQSTNGSIQLDDIKYIEAHGTGTPTGDPIELEGISKVFKNTQSSIDNCKEVPPLLIGSIKSSIGHSEAASGIASLIKCCLMFRNKLFTPNINFEKPNPSIKFKEWNLKVVTEPIPFSSNKTSMIVNNFGVTGSNCCLILSQFNDNNNNPKNNNSVKENDEMYLIPFSANSVTSLQQYQTMVIFNNIHCDNYGFKEFVENQIRSKPTSLYQRSVVIASNWDEFNYTDENSKFQTLNQNSSNISIIKKNPIIVFVFAGQGSQYSTMALNLYNNEPIFKKSMDELNGGLSSYYGFSILEKLRSIEDCDRTSIHHPTIAPPAMCMLTISLFELYKHWGIEASFIVGHSLGEIPAAYCSGMISLDTLCYLIYHRSISLIQTHGNGRMLSVNIGADEYNANYSLNYPNIEMACFNSPTSIVLGGDEQKLYQISNELKEKGVFCAMLGSLSSFHTSSQTIVKDQILKLNIKSQSPKIPIFSTVTTNQYNETDQFNSEYVYNNIIKPVKFSQTISNLYQHIEMNKLGSDIVFIELAPHPTLQFYLKQMIPKPLSQQQQPNNEEVKVTVYSPLNKKKHNDIQEIRKMISQLYCNNGYNINFKCQLKSNSSNSFSLPLYQWDEESYWRIHPSQENLLVNGPPVDHLGVVNEYSPNVKSYQTLIDIKRSPFKYLKGHMVKGKYYFPGCGYIDNLMKIYPSQDLTIVNLDFKSPLIFIEGFNQSLQSNVYQTGKTEFRIQYHCKNQKTNEWVECCVGNFQLFNHGSGDNIINIPELIDRDCNISTLSTDELYKYIKSKTGLSYTGSFQGVEKCYIGDGCSLSVVSLNLPLELLGQQSLFFNTSILDCCLHGMIALIEEQCQLVFDRFEYLKLYSSNVPKIREEWSNVYVYSKFNSRLGNSYSASITIILPNGKVLVEIEKVICTSLKPIKDPLIIEPPKNELFSTFLQPIESYLPSPTSFKSIYDQFELPNHYQSSISNYQTFIATLLFDNIQKRCSTINKTIVDSMNVDQLLELYCKDKKNFRLFKFTFETIKNYNGTNGYYHDRWNESNIEIYYNILLKSTRIIANLLFPNIKDNSDSSNNSNNNNNNNSNSISEDIDTPQSLFQDDLMDKFYTDYKFALINNQLIGEIVKESLKPMVNEKMVFRILEFGGGVSSLSIEVLNKINKLLEENPSFEISIEYTWSDISTSFIPDAKNKLSHINKRVSIVYRSLDLESLLVEKQGLKPSYYDYVIMSNVLHVVKDLKYSLNQIQTVLKPNGHILFMEPPYKSVIHDSFFGVFDQWWAFTDTDLRVDRCCMTLKNWNSLLTASNFNNIITSKEMESIPFVIQAQNQKQFQQQKSKVIEESNIIVFGDKNDCFGNLLQKNDNKYIFELETIQKFKELIDLAKVIDQTIIYFTKTAKELNLDNFKQVTYEYIQINQLLLENKLKCKHVLVTYDSSCSNYLASSIIGAARYFDEFNQLELFTIDIEKGLQVDINLFKEIECLIHGDHYAQREFFIKKDKKVFCELVKKELVHQNFKSKSFEVSNDMLYARLSPNLDYQLHSKQVILKPGEIEVQVLATGINYKDYLVYCGLVPPEMISRDCDLNNPEFGLEFSGIVTRLPKAATTTDDCEFKIGDKVYGIWYDTTSSHIVVDSNWVCKKPNNISHTEAASIPAVYLTSLYSIFKVGALEINEDESILIHSATGGVGLSALNILKWKGHKSHVFVTVGSKEKEQYLLDKYGEFITGIYSTRNKDYSQQIKLKLKQLGSNKQGVDLILNTLSSDYIDSNFNCLEIGGRIVDLSITHLNSNEFINNKRFKYNYGYHNVELVFIKKQTIKSLLKTITEAIENEKLELIPIKQFSNLQIKDAIEYINQRQHIGKIVVNNDSNLFNQLIYYDNKNNCSGSSSSSCDIDDDRKLILKTDYQILESSLGKNILITGQSGIVLEILKWIVNYCKDIENVIVLSKSSMKWELELLIGKTKKLNNKIKFHFKSVDVGDSKQVDEALNQLLVGNGEDRIENIDSIFHYAFTQIACKVEEIGMNHLEVSHGAKTMGAINLHNQSIKRNWKLKQFVMASSIVTLLGSPDQCSYVCANTVLDSLSKYRKSIGLPSICCNYGAIESAGFVSKNESVAIHLVGQGINPLSTNIILGALDLQIQNQHLSTNSLVVDLNFSVIKNYKQKLHQKFDYFLNQIADTDNGNTNISNQPMTSVKSIFINKISEFLSIDPSKINQDIRLMDYGADSLLIVQLKNWIDKQFLPNIITIQQIQNNSIASIIQIIINQLNKKTN